MCKKTQKRKTPRQKKQIYPHHEDTGKTQGHEMPNTMSSKNGDSRQSFPSLKNKPHQSTMYSIAGYTNPAHDEDFAATNGLVKHSMFETKREHQLASTPHKEWRFLPQLQCKTTQSPVAQRSSNIKSFATEERRRRLMSFSNI